MKRKRAIDSAKEFRARVLKKWQEESEPWPLSGLKQFPCERTIYLSLKPKETPNQLFRAFYNHFKELYQTHGEELAGIGNMVSLIVVPGGEAFCSFRIAKFPSLVGQTEAEMIPKVDKTVALIETYARHTERLTATIEGERELNSSDGRRLLLSECECVNMLTGEIAKTFKISKQQSSTH